MFNTAIKSVADGCIDSDPVGPDIADLTKSEIWKIKGSTILYFVMSLLCAGRSDDK